MLKMKQRNRYLELVRLILCHKVFHDVFGLYISTGTLPNKNTVATLINNARPNLSVTTPPRRADTVLSWLGWVLELLDR